MRAGPRRSCRLTGPDVVAVGNKAMVIIDETNKLVQGFLVGRNRKVANCINT